MTLAPGSGVSYASFLETTVPTSVLTVTIATDSGAARPVFASGTPAGSVTVEDVSPNRDPTRSASRAPSS